MASWSEEVHKARTRGAVSRARKEVKGQSLVPVSETKMLPIGVIAGAVSGALAWSRLDQKVKAKLASDARALAKDISRLPAVKWLRQQWRTHVLRKPPPPSAGSAAARAAAVQAAEKRAAAAQQGSKFAFPKPAAASSGSQQPGPPKGTKGKKKKSKGKGRK